MLVVFLFVSAMMLAAALAAYHSGWAMALVFGGMLFFVFCFASPAMLLNWFLLVVTAYGCRLAGQSHKRFGYWGASATAVTYLIAAVVVYPQHREIEQLKSDYPIESLSQRLAYEHEALAEQKATVVERETNTEQSDSYDERALAAVENELEMAAHKYRGRQRTSSLEGLMRAHNSYVADFINAEGFGIVRMARPLKPRRQDIELPEAKPIQQPPTESKPSGTPKPVYPLANLDEKPSEEQKFAALTQLHTNGLADFANPAGFGYVGNLDRVIGFQAHGFRTLPELADTVETNARWRVHRLELVSLLKHRPAAVYVSEHLPRMDELKEAPTRPLDEFEAGALEKLRQAQDLAVENSRNEIRMLGSIRAMNQCLECHQVERGTLLGAFSYRLRRDPLLPEAPQQADGVTSVFPEINEIKPSPVESVPRLARRFRGY